MVNFVKYKVYILYPFFSQLNNKNHFVIFDVDILIY